MASLPGTRQSGDTDQARRQIQSAVEGRNRKEKQKKLLRKELRDGAGEKNLTHVLIENATARARDSAPLRCAPRGQREWKGKT